MKWGLVRDAVGTRVSSIVGPKLKAGVPVILAMTVAMTLAGALAACSHTGAPSAAALQPRGATVAFDSIDGPPPGQFQALVRNLNDEAQTRRLAVISREGVSAYRVRGYLAAKVVQGHTTITWLWDVFDRDQHRVLRVDGEETVKESVESKLDPWSVADDAMLRRIAHTSMDELAAFLTSPGVAPDAADGAAQIALNGPPDSVALNSPEAAGIFRIFQPHADPARKAGSADGTERRPEPGEVAGPVPLPPRRPGAVTLAAATSH